MEIRGLRDVQDIVDDLSNRLDKLWDCIEDKDYDEKMMDMSQMVEFGRMLDAFVDFIVPAEAKFYRVIFDVEDMNLDKETCERFMFLVKKHQTMYIKEEILSYIYLIIAIREREFGDYRIREWQMDVARKMEMIRDYYKNMYGI